MLEGVDLGLVEGVRAGFPCVAARVMTNCDRGAIVAKLDKLHDCEYQGAGTRHLITRLRVTGVVDLCTAAKLSMSFPFSCMKPDGTGENSGQVMDSGRVVPLQSEIGS